MADRQLPKRKNPLIASLTAPSYEELLGRRRLGKTKLAVKPTQVGTSNATKPENLGVFEYAHLRAPLPSDLKGSEIFTTQSNQGHPETYFLMRRSSDGYCSATGMFKIAYPWATQAEEKAERDYLKTLDTTSADEVAGNIWIEPEFALELAEAYGLTQWIRALLDPTDISQSPSSAKKQINAPPKFEAPLDMDKVKLPPPGRTPGRGSRRLRSASPSKIASPVKSKASPRKRQTSQNKAQEEAAAASTTAASAALQSALDDAVSIAGAESVSTDQPQETPATSPSLMGESVKVEVDQEVEVKGNTETTHTNVTVEMPAGSPELPLPQDTEQMLETAKRMVEEAKELETSPKVTRKRKVEEVEPSDLDAELPQQPAKKARVLEESLKREKVRNRALFGVAATLTVA
ncbi:uncharacterized protein HMPREF1541_10059 [Cyphellophora europaea CBS 101466]|uniref:Cell pattern formation-associated protein stuA n=1 Tax=Cyphellophora europaea (strain CBS 101466) TaxID=1220924 RepID=W2S927_CYPE1|nr:uncharacterized protein HMPREF1541_10059 [Cyphellophora europaea CBS 101466]ETN45182.1 hypothetical protein HMPREF1541_10059 [Cyphellophora europaea CBS 101466]